MLAAVVQCCAAVSRQVHDWRQFLVASANQVLRCPIMHMPCSEGNDKGCTLSNCSWRGWCRCLVLAIDTDDSV